MCPAVAMRRTSSGCAAARLPSRKNVACTSCCARIVQQPRRPCGIRPVVEGERQLARPRRRSHCRAEDARTRPQRGVSVRAHRQPRTCGGAQSRVHSGCRRRDHSAVSMLPRSRRGQTEILAPPAKWCFTPCSNLQASTRLRPVRDRRYASCWPFRCRWAQPSHRSRRHAPSARVVRWSAAPAATWSSRSQRSSTPPRTAAR